MTDSSPGAWLPACHLGELTAAGKLVRELAGVEVLLLWHDERVVALANRCIHRGRELKPGILLKGRIVCPGHQWSFDLESGFCKERDRSQPVFAVRTAADGLLEVLMPAEMRVNSA